MRRAFTLIELLVVISIIALLIAILLPALGAARESARRSQCLSNVRSLAQATYAFAADNDGKIMATSSGGFNSWTMVVQDYMDAGPRVVGGVKLGYFETNFCPEAPQDRTDSEMLALTGGTSAGPSTSWYHAWGKTSSTNPSIHAGSYGINDWVTYGGPLGHPGKLPKMPRLIENVKAPSNFPMYSDAGWMGFAPMSDITDDTKPSSFEGVGTSPVDIFTESKEGLHRLMVDRHDQKLNISFLDGHAEGVAFQSLWDLQWHQTYDPIAGP